MRPDEHKKKKNATYKKKHGITNKPSGDSTGNNKNPDKKDRGNRREAAENNSRDHANTYKKNSPHQQASGTVQQNNYSDSDSDSETVRRKSYRRREIVSNWRKYELEPDSESPITSRGEDFSKLLSMAGEAMSHFRFQEEREWEDDMTRDEDGGHSDSSVASKFLNLDLSDLSTCMACIPLHQQLGIEENMFPDEQLEKQINIAKENYSSYMKEKSDVLQAKPKERKCKTRTCHVSNDKKQAKIDPIPPTANADVQSQLSQNNEPGGTGKSRCGDSVDNSKDVSSVEEMHPSLKRQSESGSSLGLLDNELDQLLDMEVSTRQEGQSEHRTSVRVGGNASKPVTPGTKKDDKKEADELEDWLDSILD